MSEPTVRGANGGNARAAKLTREHRSSIARAAAEKRWAKKENHQPVNGSLVDDAIHAEDFGLQGTIYPTYGGIERGSMPMVENNINPPSVPFQAVPQPMPPPQPTSIYIPPPPEHPKPAPKRRKPMVKEFGKAHSYAEKRLAEAIKERAEAMGKVAMLNAEIPSLVQIIKALGMTPNMNGFQDFTAPIPSMVQTYQQPVYQAPQVEPSPNDPSAIDPRLFQVNANPLPGLAPVIAGAPLMVNTSAGGAIDLGYVPTDEEGAALPQMGGGWN